MSGVFKLNVLRALGLVAVLAMPLPTPSSAQATVSAAGVAAAKELLEVAGSAKQFDVVVPIMAQQMETAFVNLKPDQREKIHEVFRLMPERFAAKKQELLDQIAVLYAQKLTIDELTGLVSFYKSPAGAKFVAMQPELLQESMALGHAWGQKIGREIEQDVRKELAERGIRL